MVDGKPVEATFDPATGALSVNGQDVTAKATPIPPASMRINLGSENNVKDVVAGMKAGTLPPQLPGAGLEGIRRHHGGSEAAGLRPRDGARPIGPRRRSTSPP
jgi:hypothetical protein